MYYHKILINFQKVFLMKANHIINFLILIVSTHPRIKTWTLKQYPLDASPICLLSETNLLLSGWS